MIIWNLISAQILVNFWSAVQKSLMFDVYFTTCTCYCESGNSENLTDHMEYWFIEKSQIIWSWFIGAKSEMCLFDPILRKFIVQRTFTVSVLDILSTQSDVSVLTHCIFRNLFSLNWPMNMNESIFTAAI